MRVVFMGTPETAVPSLKKILQSEYEVSAVFTQPDKPSGRGYRKNPSPVKLFAIQAGIPVFQPEKISDDENRRLLERMQPDYIVVAAYGQILSEQVLQTARLAPLNVHFSLLPFYRGAAPVAHAILNGEQRTGITIMIMQESLDAGPILMQRELTIPLAATMGDMESQLSENGAELLLDAMESYANRALQPVAQNDSEATWAPRITKSDACIDWSDGSLQIHNRIRAMNPRPGAYTFYKGQRIRIWSSFPESETKDEMRAADPGTYLGLDKNSLRIQCGDGKALKVNELQKPSKSRISGREFANGVRATLFDKIF